MSECQVAQPKTTLTSTTCPAIVEKGQVGHDEDSPLPITSSQSLAVPTTGKHLTRKHSRSDVSPHKTEESVWIILDGKVYDVTKFVDEHPGGSEVLLDRAGEDCTEAFEQLGHSEMARELRENYCIGTVEETDWAKKMNSPPATGDQSKGDEPKDKDNN